MANFILTTSINGLREYDFPVPEAAQYTVQGTLDLPFQAPTAPQGPGGGGIGSGSVPGLPQVSQVVTVVKINSTTVYTGPVGAKGFKTAVTATAPGDLIKVIFSSSAAIDQPLNAVKCTLSIIEGGE